MSSSGKSRRSLTKPKEDKNQTSLKKFFNVVSPKDKEQEKFKAILGSKSGSDFKDDLKEHEKENEEDTKHDGYVNVFIFPPS